MKFAKVKYSGGSLGKNKGTDKAPDLILRGINSEEIHVNNVNVDETMNNIENSSGGFLVGGDHSITYGGFKGFAKKFKNPGLIVFDAHPDLEVNSGSVTHEDYLRKLVDEGTLKKENVILVGVRKISKNELNFMKGMNVFYVNSIFNNEEFVCDSITELALGFDGLYLSVDIDVLDPAFAPGTGYLEPEGLTSQQLFYFLRRIKKMNNLRGVDLVEINPDKDINEITIGIGGRIVALFS